jgi:hypothetical protein
LWVYFATCDRIQIPTTAITLRLTRENSFSLGDLNLNSLNLITFTFFAKRSSTINCNMGNRCTRRAHSRSTALAVSRPLSCHVERSGRGKVYRSRSRIPRADYNSISSSSRFPTSSPTSLPVPPLPLNCSCQTSSSSKGCVRTPTTSLVRVYRRKRTGIHCLCDSVRIAAGIITENAKLVLVLAVGRLTISSRKAGLALRPCRGRRRRTNWLGLQGGNTGVVVCLGVSWPRS